MPPRWMSLLIIGFWLVMTGWLCWNEVIPELLAERTPLYTVDLVDEAQTQRPQLRWNILLGEQEEKTDFLATTWVEYREESDTFSLHTRLQPRFQPISARLDLGPIKLQMMYSVVRVDRTGRLQASEVEFQFDVALLQMKSVHAKMDGEVREGVFRSKYTLQSPDGQVISLHGQDIKMPPHQSMLLPMHLVDRIRDLKPGRQWRLPLINPFANALPRSGLVGDNGTSTVTLRVLDTPRPLPGYPDITCLVLEYEDEDQQPNRIWVDVATDRVLRQEGIVNGVKLVIQRENVILSQ